MTTPGVSASWSAPRTTLAFAVGFEARYSAAAPAACGAAIDVPLIVFVAVSDASQSDVIETPSAKTSTQWPKFEKLARASVMSVAPTVIAPLALPGEKAQASRLLLPAATVTVTPLAIELVTALLGAALNPPPTLMFTTAGFTTWAVTQSTPAMTAEVLPLPSHPRTRTATRCDEARAEFELGRQHVDIDGPNPPQPIELDIGAHAVPLIARYARLLDRPDLVLHATDDVFDLAFDRLPDRHHYAGPLGI